jgi:Cd2+/Zn2+-exporting ATPase
MSDQFTAKQNTDKPPADACCSADDSVQQKTSAPPKKREPELAHGLAKIWVPSLVSFLLLAFSLLADHVLKPGWFTGWVRIGWYALAYLPVGFPVVIKGVKLAVKGDLFTEFFLMGLATLGAFYIGNYPEGVAVMLFYTVGELFQHAAVDRAKRNIKALLDVRPDVAHVFREGSYQRVDPESVAIGEIIQIRAGERVPLDGVLLDERTSFNTAALTGESKPLSLKKGEAVLAGMISEGRVISLRVSKLFNDSALARIFTLVQEATSRKAPAELFIRKFARVYTPIVVFLAIGIIVFPYFIDSDYTFAKWLYRALIFLVISCPCALVISIPLGYFGGIGAGSRNGILFKGSNYLDLMTRVNTVVLDKTGTLTRGVFTVQKVVVAPGQDEKQFIQLVAALESKSTHPIANAIAAYAGKFSEEAQHVQEVPGHGLKGTVKGFEILAGNGRLLKKFSIPYDRVVDSIADTTVVVAINNTYAGYIVIADEIKEDAAQAIAGMRVENITQLVLLSGDRSSITQNIAKTLGIDAAFGDLLPEDKLKKVEAIKQNDKTRVVAFVGDGINDAPVLAVSDVGIAMGGLGSDAAIETADVVIQTDQPSKIVTAIRIGKATNRIVWQNIGLAFGVKAIVLVLGAGGLATMWEAVFADVGVALLAILNAVRIQRMKF